MDVVQGKLYGVMALGQLKRNLAPLPIPGWHGLWGVGKTRAVRELLSSSADRTTWPLASGQLARTAGLVCS
ncbi:unnamed protein product [Protopolystoma xenopodis]|uniref:Uncharacterized protein n=1 Tax=Protopolystoma xenopodis TaxID=117903 RepID=A0A448X795_9PLAT|nr:unnamed protein product [Protopolystoma xenopodis]